MKRLEAAMVVGKMVGGGVETIVMCYLRHIDREKIHYTLLVDEDSMYVPEDEIEECGADFIYIPSYKKIGEYQCFLNELFSKRRFDIIHSHINTLSYFPLLAADNSGIPVRIAHSHSTAGRGEPVRNLIKYMLRPLSDAHANELCACGDYAGKWLFGGDADFAVLPNNLDFEAESYAFNADDRALCRKENSVGDRLVIGHVGRFIPQKNHCFLLKIFAEILKRRPDALLFLIGDGKLADKTEQLANRLGIAESVRFLGVYEDIRCFYQAMDVFVLPSLYEGKPLSAMEAQYASLPVLLSDRITEETVIFPELVRFEALGASPAKWAEAAISMAETHKERKRLETQREYAGNYVAPSELADWYVRLYEKHRNDAAASK